MSLLKLDVSDELIFERHKNGIKFLRPNENQLPLSSTVKNIFDLNSCNIYLFYGDSIVAKNNERNANMCGYDSKNKLHGKLLYEIQSVPKESAFSTIKNNLHVMQSNRLHVFDEDITLFDKDFQFLSIKLPWYNEFNKAIGVFGCSVVIDKQSITESFGKIIPTLFNISETECIPTLFNNKVCGVNFTKREHDCLRLVAKGKTAKEIANILDLSPRTIEKYLENIKLKMRVNTKSELIEKIIEYCRK